jgi:hypothetical protein
VKDAIQTISFINEIDNGKEEVEPIKLIINSLGGNILDGFALIGVIENSFVPVYTYGYGSIMSMALPLAALAYSAARKTCRSTLKDTGGFFPFTTISVKDNFLGKLSWAVAVIANVNKSNNNFSFGIAQN